MSIDTSPTSASPNWELKVNISEFDIIEQSLLVSGETHIGGVIIQLVEKLNNIRNDWSDFGLWWPDKNIWLSRTKMTLDQYGVQADAHLYFTRMHKYLSVQLPDQQILELNVDFSANLFSAVKQIGKELSIRNSEEVSFLRCNNSNLKQNNKNQGLKIKKDELVTESNFKSNKENGSISSGTSTLNNSSTNSNSLKK